ncbi:MAG: DNA polymerase I, partial [Chitinophagaceae bacterium]
VETGKGWYVPLPVKKEEVVEILKRFAAVFARPDKLWIGHNTKYDLLMLKWYGFEIEGRLFDTMLAHYLIEPDGKRNMDWLAAKYLGYEPIHIEELIGKKGKNQGTMRDVELQKVKEYAVEDADITLQFKPVFEPQMTTSDVRRVFDDVEMPLVKVLRDIEFEGVRVDVDFLRAYSRQLEEEARTHEEQVYELAGQRFNLGSPKQLGEVLFEQMKLDPKAKKTKTGQYATGEDVLSKLAKEHPLCDHILAYREFTKLRSTYVDALPELINPRTGRIHTNFAQAVAVTGRLSSNNPNLQNIPIRTERGKEIRKAFIPRDENHILVSADYSQIELRIVAALSGDPAMCDAFRQGKDVHTATAAKVYNVAEEEVTKVQRSKAKSVNFGIIYGQGAFGLAENLRIPRAEAKEIIDNYRQEFAGITAYMDGTINFCREHGYVQTVLGRKRWLRDINSANFTVRALAERNAINSPIQGTAADMIKLAMVNVHNAFKKHGFRSRMILQVHDELVFDVVKEELELVQPVILEAMQSAMVLPNDIPVIAEVGSGTNWLEAH